MSAEPRRNGCSLVAVSSVCKVQIRPSKGVNLRARRACGALAGSCATKADPALVPGVNNRF